MTDLKYNFSSGFDEYGVVNSKSFKVKGNGNKIFHCLICKNV